MDSKLISCGWLELAAGLYNLRSDPKHCREVNVRPVSRCQIELDVGWQNVLSHSLEIDEFSRIAPIRILSFDIECTNRKGRYWKWG